MSTITAAPAPATRLRLTARGRRVFTTLAAAPFAAAIAFAAVSGESRSPRAMRPKALRQPSRPSR